MLQELNEISCYFFHDFSDNNAVTQYVISRRTLNQFKYIQQIQPVKKFAFRATVVCNVLLQYYTCMYYYIYYVMPLGRAVIFSVVVMYAIAAIAYQ